MNEMYFAVVCNQYKKGEIYDNRFITPHSICSFS